MNRESLRVLDNVMDLLLDTVCVVDEAGRFLFISAACERLLGYTPEELIGRKMIELVHPEDRERTLAAAEHVMHGEPHTHFENRYIRKDGRTVHIMWSARWSEAEGVRLAVARDVTALRRASDMQSALYRISEAAHAAEGLPALYRHIHQIVSDLLPADTFYVALYDRANGKLSFPYFVGELKHEPELQPLGTGTLIAEVIHSGKALLKSSADSGTARDAAQPGARGYIDWLGVPLTSQAGVIGALVVQSFSGGARYAEQDKELLQYISTQVATAIERKQAETHLRRMARYDALTDVPNRTLFHDRFEMALKRARRDQERLALLYLDLDDFKRINDTFGHEVGDVVLCEAARRLSQCVRDSDTIGRMGGDEFTVLLINIETPECADTVADKIRTALNAPFDLNGSELGISASIGIAIYPEHGDDREQLFRHADARMYAAKRLRN